MKVSSLALPFLFIAANASGTELTAKYGFGFMLPEGLLSPAAKVLTLGIQDKFFVNHIYYQTEVGIIRDSMNGWGRSGTMLLSGSLGTGLDFSHFYSRVFIGPALITNPDALLNGVFQFTQDLEIGIKDSHNRKIGLGYKHISNAGVIPPNRGRDFIYVRFGFPF